MLHIRTQQKLTAIFALAGSVTVLIGILSFQSVSHLRVEGARVAHTHEVLGELSALSSSFIAAESTGAAASQAETREHLRAVRKLTADNPAQQARVGALETLIEKAFRDPAPISCMPPEIGGSQGRSLFSSQIHPTKCNGCRNSDFENASRQTR